MYIYVFHNSDHVTYGSVGGGVRNDWPFQHDLTCSIFRLSLID